MRVSVGATLACVAGPSARSSIVAGCSSPSVSCVLFNIGYSEISGRKPLEFDIRKVLMSLRIESDNHEEVLQVISIPISKVDGSYRTNKSTEADEG